MLRLLNEVILVLFATPFLSDWDQARTSRGLSANANLLPSRLRGASLWNLLLLYTWLLWGRSLSACSRVSKLRAILRFVTFALSIADALTLDSV